MVHERGHLLVVEELRQRLGAWRDVTADDRVAAGCVVELPVNDPIEEHLEVTQSRPDRVDRQRLTGGVMGVGDQLEFERLDVRTTDVGGASNRRVVLDDPEPEPDERVRYRLDRRRLQRDRLLGDVAAHRRIQQRRANRQRVPRCRP